MTTLAQVVEDLLASRTWTPDTVVFRCDTISRIFARRCREAGIDAQVLRLGPARGPLPRMHAKWRRMVGTSDGTGECDGHHVVLVHGLVHDFTFLQFDHEASVPHVSTLEQIHLAWDGMEAVPST